MQRKSLEKKGLLDDVDMIYTYSREDAIEDGILIQVDTKTSNEAGFNFPIAIHKHVWEKYINWIEEDNKRQLYQDLEGRLWDMLCMLRLAIRTVPRGSDKIRFSLRAVPREISSKTKKPRLVHLWAICHPGDNLEPVITVLENEDD